MSRKQLKDYIKENINIDGVDYRETDLAEFKKWWSKIEKDCSHWIKEMSHNNPSKQLVYRGTITPKDDFDIITTRTDRHPKDMSYHWHKALDEIFNDKFGWKPRSEGVFVANKNTADSYGKVFIVFPIGRYKYLWSDRYADLYSYIHDDYSSEPSSNTISQWENDWEEEYGEGSNGDWYSDGHSTGYSSKNEAIDNIIEDRVKDIEDQLDELDEEDTDREQLEDELSDVRSSSYRGEVEDGLEWEPEVSLDSYIDSRREDWSSSEESDVSDSAEDIINDGKYQSTNIIQGIKSDKEVMLGCTKYYVISNSYETLIRKYLFDLEFDPDQLSFDFK